MNQNIVGNIIWKVLQVTLISVLSFSLLSTCDDFESPEENNTEDSSADDCVTTMSILTVLITSLSSSSSTEYSASETETNNTFSLADYTGSFSSSYSTSALSTLGSMSSAADVDILYHYYTSGTSSTTTVKLSQTSGDATCIAYTHNGASSLNTAVVDSNFTSVGTLTSTQTSVTLNLAGDNYLYVHCSGASGASYAVKAESDVYSDYTTQLTTFMNAMTALCTLAE